MSEEQKSAMALAEQVLANMTPEQLQAIIAGQGAALAADERLKATCGVGKAKGAGIAVKGDTVTITCEVDHAIGKFKARVKAKNTGEKDKPAKAIRVFESISVTVSGREYKGQVLLYEQALV